MYENAPKALLQDAAGTVTEGWRERAVALQKAGIGRAAERRPPPRGASMEANSGICVLSPQALHKGQGQNGTPVRAAGELETLFRGTAGGSKHSSSGGSTASVFDAVEAIAGDLDLTSVADRPQTHALTLANLVAEQIEHRLFEDRFRGYELLNFYPDRCPIGGSQDGLIAFDNGRLVGASRKAIAFLGQDRLLLGASFDDLFAVEPGSVSNNEASDDCILRTKDGKSFYARIRPQSYVWPSRMPEAHRNPEKTEDEPQLRQIVGRILNGPSARQLNVRRVKAGQLIYGTGEGQPGELSLLTVRSGRLRCFASCEGKELTLFTLDAGDAMLVGADSMFEVKRDGEIVIINGKAFCKLARQDPDLALSAVPAIGRMLQKAAQMIEDIVFRGVKFRFIRALCETAGRDGRQSGQGIILDKPPSAEEFAMQIGATRQSVSTVMAGLIRDGIVRRLDASSIAIADLKRLRSELA